MKLTKWKITKKWWIASEARTFALDFIVEHDTKIFTHQRLLKARNENIKKIIKEQ